MIYLRNLFSSTKLRAFVTTFITVTLPLFFVEIKQETVQSTTKKRYAKASFFSVDDLQYPWQKQLLYWVDFENPLIFTDKAGNMSFTYEPPKTNFQPAPIPSIVINPQQVLNDEISSTLPITFLPTYSFGWALQDSFQGFLTLPWSLKEEKISLPKNLNIYDTYGNCLDFIDPINIEENKFKHDSLSTTVISVTTIEGRSPRVLLRKSCGNKDADKAVLLKVTKFLSLQSNQEKWASFFKKSHNNVLVNWWVEAINAKN